MYLVKTPQKIEYGEPEYPTPSSKVFSEIWQNDTEFEKLKAVLTNDQLNFEWPAYYKHGGFIREYAVPAADIEKLPPDVTVSGFINVFGE